MRKFLRLALVSGLLFCWTDNNLLAADTADLLPLKQGTKWHYDAKVNGMSGSMIIRVAKIQSGAGRQAAQLETLVNGNVTATEFLGISDEGVFRLKMNGNDLTPPLQVLRFPIKKSDTWAAESTVAGQTFKTTNVVDLQKVSVPAGNFEAVLVTMEANTPQGRMTNKQWFAPGIGLVKQDVHFSGGSISAELKKFEPAK